MNMFESADVVATPKKAKKPEALQFNYGDDVDGLAAVSALIKSLESVKETLSSSIKTRAQEQFVELAGVSGLRPANFKVTGAASIASVELRKRATTSALSSEEALVLSAAGITVDRKDEDVFVFNGAMLKNKTMMNRISEALKDVELTDDFQGQSIVQRHVSPSVVGETAVEEVFALKDASEIARLLPLVSVLGLKPKLNTQDLDVIMNLVKATGLSLSE